MLLELFEKYRFKFFPLLGKAFQRSDFCDINLSVNNEHLDLEKIQTYEGLEKFIKNELELKNAKVGIGGYLEKRVLYQQSSNFKNSAENRNIHLGVDWWCDAGTKIYAPLDGIVHSFKYNAAHLDYGATIILQHKIEGHLFYSLYGHLNLASLEKLEKGILIKKGTPFTAMGNRNENGGWVPHLHFQIIQDMMNKEGDFPGVTSENDLTFFSKNCPDPNVFFSY